MAATSPVPHSVNVRSTSSATVAKPSPRDGFDLLRRFFELALVGEHLREPGAPRRHARLRVDHPAGRILEIGRATLLA